jgi:hypothetical protein
MRSTLSGHALTVGVLNKETPEFHHSNGTRISVRPLKTRSLLEDGPTNPGIENASARPWPTAALTASRAPARRRTLPSL